MPVIEEVRTNQETWRDWIGPDEPEPDRLYSRDELVGMANQWIRPPLKTVKPRDLRLWEQLGILPRGIRRGHRGASRNVYPGWTADLARHVRRLQHQGYTLDEIKPRARTHARLMLGHGRTPLDEEISARYRNIQAPEDIRLWPDLTSELERLARWRAHLTGVETDRVEVRVIGTDGVGTTYPWPIAPYRELTD